MRLITAHRILIGTAVVFFGFYALWEYRGTAGDGEIWRSIASLLAAVVLLVYLLTLRMRDVPPEDGGGKGES